MTTAFDKLERRFGRFALPNLTLWILAGQILVWALAAANIFNLEPLLALVPQKLLTGELWRIISFLWVPPTQGVSIWAIFAFIVFYWYGTVLENSWGTFRYNCFVLLAVVLTVLASLLVYALVPPQVRAMPWAMPNSFVIGAIFLAFVLINPNYQILLFFVLPIKIRWLGWLTFAFWIYLLFFGSLLLSCGVLAALVTLAVFFGRELIDSSRMKRRSKAFYAESRALAEEPFHRCSVCGVTDTEEPDLRFAYQNGKGYCERHWDLMDKEGDEKQPARQDSGSSGF